MKAINSKISAKYNIGRYGNVGHEVQDGNKRVFISNSSKDDFTSWLLAVDFAKAYFKNKPIKSSTMAVKKTPAKKVDHKLTATQKMHLKNLLQKELPKNTFDKLCTDLGLNASLPKGMTKAVARNIKITGLSKTTGRILKGYKYA